MTIYNHQGRNQGTSSRIIINITIIRKCLNPPVTRALCFQSWSPDPEKKMIVTKVSWLSSIYHNYHQSNCHHDHHQGTWHLASSPSFSSSRTSPYWADWILSELVWSSSWKKNIVSKSSSKPPNQQWSPPSSSGHPPGWAWWSPAWASPPPPPPRPPSQPISLITWGNNHLDISQNCGDHLGWWNPDNLMIRRSVDQAGLAISMISLHLQKSHFRIWGFQVFRWNRQETGFHVDLFLAWSLAWNTIDRPLFKHSSYTHLPSLDRYPMIIDTKAPIPMTMAAISFRLIWRWWAHHLWKQVGGELRTGSAPPPPSRLRPGPGTHKATPGQSLGTQEPPRLQGRQNIETEYGCANILSSFANLFGKGSFINYRMCEW